MFCYKLNIPDTPILSEQNSRIWEITNSNYEHTHWNAHLSWPHRSILRIFSSVEVVNLKVPESFVCSSSLTGDAYRFTIQPNFMNLQTEARCHIRNRRRLAAGKQTVYELFFFLQAPHSSFQTPVVHEKVEADRPEFLVRGDHSSGYLTVHHDAGLELDEEMILTKEDWQNGSAYFLEKMEGSGVGEEGDRSSDGSDNRGDVVVHQISQYVHAASVGFNRPFEFSSSSWGLENDCHKKNVNKMKAPRRAGRKDDTDRVDVLIDSTQAPIKYYLKSLKKAPFIRFTVPGKQDDSRILISGIVLILYSFSHSITFEFAKQFQAKFFWHTRSII